MKQIIISSAQGGLANRVKCLINSIYISKKLKGDLFLYWPKNDACNCEFSDLFEKKIKIILKKDLRKILKNKNYEIYDNSTKKIKGKKRYIILNITKILNLKNQQVNLWDVNLPSYKWPIKIRRFVIKTFLDLKFKKEINKKVIYFMNKKLKGNIMGVHIRRGDFLNIKEGVVKISPTIKFEKKIKKELELNPKIKIFLSTDSISEKKDLIKKFGKKIITFPKKTKNRKERGAIIEALIELLLLSKTNKIYGTYDSTFNELASWINLKNKRQIIFDKQEFKKYNQRKKYEKNKFINLVKNILYKTLNPLHKRFLDKN